LANDLDQFYTNVDVVEKCLEGISFDDYDIVLEPSAGSGSFLNLLPKDKRQGLDLEPAHDEVIKQDFFDFVPDSSKKYYVVGNPPFGKNSSLAVKFFNKSAKFADKIAFIIPRTFRKEEFQNKLDLNFHLVREELLPEESFHTPMGEAYKVPCVFQIWEKRNTKREKVEVLRTHEDFEFLSPQDYDFVLRDVVVNVNGSTYKSKDQIKYDSMTDEELEQIKKLRSKFPELFSNHDIRNVDKEITWKRTPTFAWRRAGSNAGKVYTDFDDCPLQGFEFILAKNDKVLYIFEKLWDTLWSSQADPGRLNAKWDTVGQASISKSQLIKAYSKTKCLLITEP